MLPHYGRCTRSTWTPSWPSSAALIWQPAPAPLWQVHEEHVDSILAELCSRVLTGKEEQRDICSIGLKTAVLYL